VRWCLAREKYQCLQNEKESKITHKVQVDTRKIISESRVKYSVSVSTIYYGLPCARPVLYLI
jgi:myosin V